MTEKSMDVGEQVVNQGILFPAVTWDYYVTANGKFGGFGLVARRKIRKGELIFSDSIEYTFSDVINEGDYLLLDRNKKASRLSKTKVPKKFPISRETLMKTHGIPRLRNEDKTLTWNLEVPGLFMNHSCNPNVSAFPRSSDRAEDYATRDIKKGEELTVDYALQYYNEGPLFEECLCGEDNCRGKMMGFVALSDEDKERLLPSASDAVQAMHKADTGQGPPVETAQEPVTPRTTTYGVPRLAVPGPSHALAEVIVKQDDETGEFGLYSLKDFSIRERVYEFWSMPWPRGLPDVINMVFATPLTEGDPPEGTTVRVDVSKCAFRDRQGRYMLSIWDLFTKHSCEPSLVYDNGHHQEDEDDDWHSAYAARDIKAGEQLTADYNCMLWDRNFNDDEGKCQCATAKCTGTQNGFKHLPPEAQEERKLMSWNQRAHEGEKQKWIPGEALSPHVRESWRKDSALKDRAPDSGSSDSSSSEEESD